MKSYNFQNYFDSITYWANTWKMSLKVIPKLSLWEIQYMWTVAMEQNMGVPMLTIEIRWVQIPPSQSICCQFMLSLKTIVSLFVKPKKKFTDTKNTKSHCSKHSSWILRNSYCACYYKSSLQLCTFLLKLWPWLPNLK